MSAFGLDAQAVSCCMVQDRCCVVHDSCHCLSDASCILCGGTASALTCAGALFTSKSASCFSALSSLAKPAQSQDRIGSSRLPCAAAASRSTHVRRQTRTVFTRNERSTRQSKRTNRMKRLRY